MAKFLNLLKAMGFSTAADAAVQVGTSTDTQPRLQIDAGGKHTWGAGGSNAGDTTLYRSAADTLKTDDAFIAAGGLTVKTIEIDTAGATTNQILKFDGTKFAPATGGGGGGASTLDDLTDVTAPTPSTGDFLKWNGTAWVNDPIDLSTDTSGDYVASLVAGTGVTLSNNSGEGATPTIAIGQAVGTTDSVTFDGATISNLSLGVYDYAGTGVITTSAQLTELQIGPFPSSANDITGPNITLFAGGASGSGVITGGRLRLFGGDATTTSGNAFGGDIFIDAGTGVDGNGDIYIGTLSGRETNISIGSYGKTVAFDSDITAAGDVKINQSLILNYQETSTPTLNAGIEVERGTSLNASVYWQEEENGGHWRVSGTRYNYDLEEEFSYDSPILTGLSTLSDLADVEVAGSGNGSALIYDSSAGEWLPKSDVRNLHIQFLMEVI